jgi:hypothetical protein
LFLGGYKDGKECILPTYAGKPVSLQMIAVAIFANIVKSAVAMIKMMMTTIDMPQ